MDEAHRPADAEASHHQTSSLVAWATTVLAVTILYFGSGVLVPFTLALLLSFVLAPLVDRLRGWRFPRVVAVALVIALAVLVISGVSLVVSRQVVSLAAAIPLYQQNIQAKISSLQQVVPGGGLLERMTRAVKGIQEDLKDATSGGAGPASGKEPVTVRLEPEEPSPLKTVTGLLGPLVGPSGTAGIVIVLTIFMLLGKEDLRNRLIRVMGTGDLHRTTQALNEAATRVSRYLLMQSIVNALYGAAIGSGLYLVGVPNPILWGLLAMALRFIPYLGPILSAAFPLALSVAVTPGWAPLAWTAGLFAVVELITGNFVEPWLYGASTGVSPPAIIFAAVFWTWVWGGVGLLLSTPLTVCLVVLGRHLPQMQIFNVLFGSERVLTAAERLYQRLLAGDVDEALEVAEDHLIDKPVVDLFDTVMLPALRLGDWDRRRGVLDEEGARTLSAGFAAVIEAVVQDHLDMPTEPPATGEVPPLVLCVPARTVFDTATASMLVALLAASGQPGRVSQRPPASPADKTGALDGYPGPVAAACLCMVQTTTARQAHRSWQRLSRRLPQVPAVLCLWDLEAGDAGAASGQPSDPPVVTSFQAALNHLVPQTLQGLAAQQAPGERADNI
jgi:predicted PurR-regulated permease PerM